jgi:hypothetical protein
MIGDSKRAWCRVGVLAAITTSVCIASSPKVEGQSSTTPQYAPDGELLAPVGFETWVFVGSNLGMAYRPEAPAMTSAEAARADKRIFHNIYINPEAYTHFLATQEFPEPTNPRDGALCRR